MRISCWSCINFSRWLLWQGIGKLENHLYLYQIDGLPDYLERENTPSRQIPWIYDFKVLDIPEIFDVSRCKGETMLAGDGSNL